MRKTVIVVPCYNESKRLNKDAFIEAAAKEKGLHFLFVNDGSTDSTLEVLNGLKKANPAQLDYLSLEKNSGKAEAVRRGFAAALEGDSVNIGYWDADLATPLEEIEKFCRILDETKAALVIASRVRLLGRDIQRRAARHYLGRVFATFASMLLKIPVYDTQCGAKIFKRSDDLKKAFSKPFNVKWTFDVELFARLLLLNREASGAWVEYPIEKWADVKGSKLKQTDFLKGGIEFLKIFSILYIPFIRRGYVEGLKGKS